METSITRRTLLLNGCKTVAGASLLGSFLAACGGSSSGEGSTTHQLQYWALNYQPKGSNQTGKLTDAAIAAYQKKHSDTKVAITGFTGDSAGFTKVTQAVRGGNSVDLFRIPSDSFPLLVKQGLVTPIDTYLSADDKADIYPNLLEAVTFNGKAYAWPLWVPPVGMYLNLDIFKERGVEVPKDNWTYDEFVEIAKKLTFTRSNGTKVYGYTGAVDADIVNTWPIIMGDGGTPLSADHKKYTFNSPEGISGLQKLVDLALKHKVTPPDFGTQSPTDIATGFSDKKNYAMYSEPSGASSGYKQLGMNFTVKSMPIGGLGKPLTTGGIGLIAIAKIDDEARVKAAMDLARYLTSTEVGKDVSGYYLAPGARKSVTVQDPISLFSPFVSYTALMPVIAEWEQIRKLIHTQIQNAIFGKTSPAQAFNAPAKEINGILAGAD
jgi:multiple sugar transport system substrate-binding protein